MNDRHGTMLGLITYGPRDIEKESLCVPCLICGKAVELKSMEKERLLHIGNYVPVKVCAECKDAIEFIKRRRRREAK